MYGCGIGGAAHLSCQIRGAQAGPRPFVLSGGLFALSFELFVDCFSFAVLKFGRAVVVSAGFGKAHALAARGEALVPVFSAHFRRAEAALLDRE